MKLYNFQRWKIIYSIRARRFDIIFRFTRDTIGTYYEKRDKVSHIKNARNVIRRWRSVRRFVDYPLYNVLHSFCFITLYYYYTRVTVKT